MGSFELLDCWRLSTATLGEYDERGILVCELRLHMLAHPHCPKFSSRYITVFGREAYDTCQRGARQALAEICADLEEDIEFTPAIFFPVLNQTTPTWCDKVRDLEKISPQAPKYTCVSTAPSVCLGASPPSRLCAFAPARPIAPHGCEAAPILLRRPCATVPACLVAPMHVGTVLDR